VIHRSDHFLVQNTELTCSAAPIFDMQGRVIAALDISGSSSGGADAHPGAGRYRGAEHREPARCCNPASSITVLRFHRCAEFVSTPVKGCWRSMKRHVIGANRATLEALGYCDHKSLCGQRIDTILDVPLATLLHMGMRHGFRPEPLSTRFGHQKFFAVVQAAGRRIPSGTEIRGGWRQGFRCAGRDAADRIR